MAVKSLNNIQNNKNINLI